MLNLTTNQAPRIVNSPTTILRDIMMIFERPSLPLAFDPPRSAVFSLFLTGRLELCEGVVLRLCDPITLV
jgi:hypothetical protein